MIVTDALMSFLRRCFQNNVSINTVIGLAILESTLHRLKSKDFMKFPTWDNRTSLVIYAEKKLFEIPSTFYSYDLISEYFSLRSTT